jgi:hypothetical protein
MKLPRTSNAAALGIALLLAALPAAAAEKSVSFQFDVNGQPESWLLKFAAGRDTAQVVLHELGPMMQACDYRQGDKGLQALVDQLTKANAATVKGSDYWSLRGEPNFHNLKACKLEKQPTVSVPVNAPVMHVRDQYSSKNQSVTLVKYSGATQSSTSGVVDESSDAHTPWLRYERTVWDNKIFDCVHQTLPYGDGTYKPVGKCVVKYLNEQERQRLRLTAEGGVLKDQSKAVFDTSARFDADEANLLSAPPLPAWLYKYKSTGKSQQQMCESIMRQVEQNGCLGVRDTLAHRSYHEDAGQTVNAWRHRPAIWVMDPQGNLYVKVIHPVGLFHHSSFLAGGDVLSAGEIVIDKGKVTHINNMSGHYFPTDESLNNAIGVLRSMGVLAPDVIVFEVAARKWTQGGKDMTAPPDDGLARVRRRAEGDAQGAARRAPEAGPHRRRLPRHLVLQDAPQDRRPQRAVDDQVLFGLRRAVGRRRLAPRSLLTLRASPL